MANRQLQTEEDPSEGLSPISASTSGDTCDLGGVIGDTAEMCSTLSSADDSVRLHADLLSGSASSLDVAQSDHMEVPLQEAKVMCDDKHFLGGTSSSGGSIPMLMDVACSDLGERASLRLENAQLRKDVKDKEDVIKDAQALVAQKDLEIAQLKARLQALGDEL